MEIKVPDKNLTVETALGVNDVVFRDVRTDPFEIYGLYEPRRPGAFRRLPDEVAEGTNPGVVELNTHTAGGRIRFSTDSPYVALRVKMPGVCRMPHMPLTGSSGFDLYLDDPASSGSRYFRTFIPPMDMQTGYESIIHFGSRKTRYVTINFPTYNPVTELYLGLADGSSLGRGMAYRDLPPVVYFGSSITQGGCSSRPGNTYQAVIGRRFNLDHLNLGFSGNGRAEGKIVDYLAHLPMCAFVSDYDHNAWNADYLWKTHYPLYRAIRDANPDLPYIIISRPDFFVDPECPARRGAAYDTYRRAREEGDRHVYWIDGESFFRGEYEDMCTVDTCHPNDFGFARMAAVIGCELERALIGWGD